MPAVSKNQQQAAAIALKAKREGGASNLRSGAAKDMAQSMSEEELEKYASTKRKGLPKKKTKKESADWAGSTLSEIFAEEMLDASTEDAKAEDQIASQKSEVEQLEDQDIGNGKGTRDTWTSVAGGKQPALASHPRGPMSGNTMGTRVAEEIDLTRWSKIAGLLTEQVMDVENVQGEECHMCGGKIDPDMGECEDCGFRNPPDPTRVPSADRTRLEPGNIAASIEDMFESKLNEMDDAQLKRYVKRQVLNGWTWEEVSRKLKDQYGVSPGELVKLKAVFDGEGKPPVKESLGDNDLDLLFVDD